MTTDTSAAAFQVALWELAYGTSDRSLATGAFQLLGSSSNPVYQTVQGWLSNLDGTGPQASGLAVLVNNQRLENCQDLLTQASVPEAGTLALLMLGLAGLAWSQQKKLRSGALAA